MIGKELATQTGPVGTLQESWLEQVAANMVRVSDHTFAETEVASVLKDAAASRGKMIRPTLLLISAAFGPQWESRKDRLCLLAAMVELTHMASLVHDDIVDEAPMRRGVESIQGKYGKDAAIFAGDFLIARTNYYLFKEHLNEAGEILSRTVEQMCAGEIGQARWRYREDVTMEQYLKNIQGKTTALFRAACQIGASESGCTPDVAVKLEKIGEYLGILFQMRDDLLDFTADTTAVGKETHKDFRDGIYTMPVLMTVADEEGKKQLAPLIEKNKTCALSNDDIRQMEEIVFACGGVERTKTEIRRYHDMITDLLASFGESAPAETLAELVRKLEV